MNKAEDMYIISALHEIPILTKRIEKQKEDLAKYASSISNFTPEFGSTDAQKKEVEKLLQSTLDLIERQRWLKRCIAFTNAVSKIEIDGFTYSVTELLAIKAEARNVSYGGRKQTEEIKINRTGGEKWQSTDAAYAGIFLTKKRKDTNFQN